MQPSFKKLSIDYSHKQTSISLAYELDSRFKGFVMQTIPATTTTYKQTLTPHKYFQPEP